MMGDSEHPDPTEDEHDATSSGDAASADAEEATSTAGPASDDADHAGDAEASDRASDDGDDDVSDDEDGATDDEDASADAPSEPTDEADAGADDAGADDAGADDAGADDAGADDAGADEADADEPTDPSNAMAVIDDPDTEDSDADRGSAGESDAAADVTETSDAGHEEDVAAAPESSDADDDVETRDTMVDDPMQYASAATSAAAELTSQPPSAPMGTPEAPDDPMLAEADLPPPASVPAPMPFIKPKIIPAAAVNEVSPDTGSILGGGRVTITGDNLFRESIVRFGGELARTIGATEPHELRVEAPATRRAGKVDVSVQNPGSDFTEVKGAYTYEALPPPKISSVAPNRGSTKGGTELQIVGEGFVPTTKVLLSGHEATVTFVDPTTLDAKTPAGENGTTLDVEVENPDGKKDGAPRAFMFDERYD